MVLNIGTTDNAVIVVKIFTAVGEEGTRKGRGAVISLTSHDESGRKIGETVHNTSANGEDTIKTKAEVVLNAIKEHTKDCRDIHGTKAFDGHIETKVEQPTPRKTTPVGALRK